MPPTVLVTNPTPDLYGASRMALEATIGFCERGWDVVVSFPHRGPLVPEMEAAGARVRITPSPVLRKQYLSPLGLLQLAAQGLRSVPAAVALLREVRPDVVYVNTLTEPLWTVLAAMLRIPVVCHVHEAETSSPVALRRAMSAPLLLSRRVIFNSRFCRDVTLESWRRLAGRSVVVLNGIVGPGEPQPARGGIDGPVRLLYTGRLSERKGVADAVVAVGVLQRRGLDAVLDVVGDVHPGYEWVQGDLRTLAGELPVADRVRFHGFEPRTWPHLADADVLVVPSRLDESFGNTAVEGLLAARPVVATARGGLGEAVDGYEAVERVPPSQPEAIADAIESLVARWNDVRVAAGRDARLAAARHAPSRYRDEIVAVAESSVR